MTEQTERQVQSESIGKLAMALSKAQGQIESAIKDSKNDFFKSNYADLSSCINAVREPLSKNELCVIQTMRDSDKGITIITTLAHSSGEWIRGELTLCPKKNDDQGYGSSITYGRRYSLAAIINLSQKDDDANESSGKSTNPVDETDTIDRLQEEADKNAGNVEKLGAWYGTKRPEIAKLSTPNQKKINAYVKQLKDILEEDAKQGE